MDASEMARALNARRARTTRICQRCSMSFDGYADKAGGKFCSPRCRQAAWAAENRERERQRLKDYRAKRRAARHDRPEGE